MTLEGILAVLKAIHSSGIDTAAIEKVKAWLKKEHGVTDETLKNAYRQLDIDPETLPGVPAVITPPPPSDGTGPVYGQPMSEQQLQAIIPSLQEGDTIWESDDPPPTFKVMQRGIGVPMPGYHIISTRVN